MTPKTLILISLIAVRLSAQNDTFNLRPVLQPGMNIGGHIFGKETVLYHAALNNAGEFVFSACCEGGKDAVAIFTSRRIIAKQGDVIDGHIVTFIPPDSAIALNNTGKVAFEAWYVDDKANASVAVLWYEGIFVEDRLMLTESIDTLNDRYVLTDDGKIVLHPGVISAASAPDATPPTPKKPGLFDRIQIKPPKLPHDFPISISPKRSERPAKSPTRFPEQPPLSDPVLSMLSRNREGQILIPVNLRPDGFMLLLASPVKH